MHTLPLIFAALVAVTQPPTDTPARRTAYYALKGEYGKLQQWQRDGYEKILANRPGEIQAHGYAYLTSYGPKIDPPGMFGGKYARDGALLNETMCAADKHLPMGSLVWCGGELRVKRDTGGAVTVRNAKARNPRNNRNLDYYVEGYRARFSSRSTYYVALKGDWRH